MCNGSSLTGCKFTAFSSLLQIFLSFFSKLPVYLKCRVSNLLETTYYIGKKARKTIYFIDIFTIFAPKNKKNYFNF